jgi:uncharacterized protein YpmB
MAETGIELRKLSILIIIIIITIIIIIVMIRKFDLFPTITFEPTPLRETVERSNKHASFGTVLTYS